MSYSISGTTINLTRGDTFEAVVTAVDSTDDIYIPQDGDSIRFAMKCKYDDAKPILVVNIPTDTMILTLKPEDTKELPFGKYVYDIQLTYADGRVDTFITKAKLNITEEVC